MSAHRWRIGDLVERDAMYNCPAIGVVIAEHSRETFTLFILLLQSTHRSGIAVAASPETRWKRVAVGDK